MGAKGIFFYWLNFSTKQLKIFNSGSKDKPQQPQPNQPAEPKPVVIPPKAPSTLTDADYAFLTSQTHMPKEDIKNIFDKFMANNPVSIQFKWLKYL